MEPQKKRSLFPFVIGGTILALGVWIVLREEPDAPRPVTVTPAPPEPPVASEPAALPAIVTLSVAPELSATLNRPEGNPEEDLDAVAQLLYVYRQGFGENPVGQNEDVVAALLGANEKRTAYLPADSPAIVGGKLVDRWGSPYWFHPVSGREMEIRSAGPDRELFTGDDISLP